MDNLKQSYIPHLEWEYTNLPITISILQFERYDWGFTETATISIWRDKNYQLVATISGIVTEFRKLNENEFIGKGNIIKGQTIIGNDSEGNIVELYECLLDDFETNSISIGYVKGFMSIDSFKIKFLKKGNASQRIRFEWFICDNIHVHMLGTTYRNQNNKKIRIGIDKEIDIDSKKIVSGCSYSHDYTLINLSECNFIVSKVPEVILGNKLSGICFEFRENFEIITDDFIEGIANFISFLFGNEIIHIGSSIVDGLCLDEVNYRSAIKTSNKVGMPPIKFNTKYDWGDFSYLLNTLLPKYLILRKTIPIDEALNSYWVSKELPLGLNLPILSNAIEIIADKYLEVQINYSNEYLSKDYYRNLIKEELKQIKIKFGAIAGGEIILNKFLNAYKKGPNEKMRSFLLALGIEIGKMEKEALSLRNKMAHTSRDYSNHQVAHNDLIYSRIYEVLFNRIILKLLDYDGYYIDYSIKGCPLKHINKMAGE